MPSSRFSRRDLVKAVGALTGGSLLCQTVGCKPPAMSRPNEAAEQAGGSADYTLTIAVKPVELAPKRIVSTTTTLVQDSVFAEYALLILKGTPILSR